VERSGPAMMAAAEWAQVRTGGLVVMGESYLPLTVGVNRARILPSIHLGLGPVTSVRALNLTANLVPADFNKMKILGSSRPLPLCKKKKEKKNALGKSYRAPSSLRCFLVRKFKNRVDGVQLAGNLRNRKAQLMQSLGAHLWWCFEGNKPFFHRLS
jgi:hypothetical protein